MLWIGSGRFDGRIGDGDGPRACRGPDAGIETHGQVRPGVPTGTVTLVRDSEWRNLRLNCQWHVYNYDRKSLSSAKVSVAVSI